MLEKEPLGAYYIELFLSLWHAVLYIGLVIAQQAQVCRRPT